MYGELGLAVKRTRRKRLERALRPHPLLTAQSGVVAGLRHRRDRGRQRFRVLSIIDGFTKQNLVLETDTSFPSRRITRGLERTILERGLPQAIRCDNGPETTSRHFLAWAIDRRIDVVHIRPGKPVENAYVESFHGRLRDECLHVSWFWNLFDARRKISAWQRDYNFPASTQLAELSNPGRVRAAVAACFAFLHF